MGVVVCSFELNGVTLSEATQRMNAIKAKLQEVAPGAGEVLKIASIDYRSESGDLT